MIKSKAKSELKAALDALQVKKPLRLPSSAPTFAPPTPQVAQADSEPLVPAATQVAPQTTVPVATLVAGDTPVAVETMVPVQTKVESVSTGNQTEVTTSVARETQVAPQTMVPVETLVPSNTPVPVPTQVPTPTQVAIATTVPRRTLVDGGTKVSTKSESHHAPEQDSAVVLEAQASPKLQHGYTRIPNTLLMQMVSGNLLRSEMQVALLIARLTISYQRRFSPISKAVVERQTGLRGPAVLQALSELVAKGVIEKIPGDQNRPNQFGLTSAEEFFAAAGKPIESASPSTLVHTATRVPAQTTVAIGTPARVPAATSPLVPVGIYFKDTERYKSLSQLPEPLRKYFDELKPAKKRESEWNSFEELRTDYAIEDIADCYALLQARGIRRGPNGEESQPCHSPMAYLAKAMGDIIGEVESRRQKARERAVREKQEAEAERLKREIEVREAAEWAEKERAFNKAFPGEERQMEALTELLRGLPFSPGSQAGRIMGKGKWWDELTDYERTELRQ